MKRIIIITALILSVLSWQCSKVDQSLSLKESIELNTAKINSAVDKIAESKGYQVLSITEDGTKSEGTEGFTDSIELELMQVFMILSPELISPVTFTSRSGFSGKPAKMKS